MNQERTTKFARPKAAGRVTSGVLLVSAMLFVIPISDATAATNPAPVDLGSAASFGVLAGAGVTNSGPTVIGGDLGTSPTPTITGFPPGSVTPPGTIHAGDATAATAQGSAGAASVDAAGRAPDQTFTGGADLVGQTLTAGVYKSASSLSLSGNLTLDAEGNPDAVFIFQIGSTLTTGSSSTVVLANGAQACNVFWQVGSSVTLGSSSTFTGTILASTAASLGDGVDVQGRVFASTASVTLLNDTISVPSCAPQDGVSQNPLLGRWGAAVVLAAFLAGVGVLVVRRRARPEPIQ